MRRHHSRVWGTAPGRSPDHDRPRVRGGGGGVAPPRGREDPRGLHDPDTEGLTAIAALLAGRPGEADGLADPALNGTDEISLWRAVRAAAQDEAAPGAAALFAATAQAAAGLPGCFAGSPAALGGRDDGRRWRGRRGRRLAGLSAGRPPPTLRARVADGSQGRRRGRVGGLRRRGGGAGPVGQRPGRDPRHIAAPVHRCPVPRQCRRCVGAQLHGLAGRRGGSGRCACAWPAYGPRQANGGPPSPFCGIRKFSTPTTPPVIDDRAASLLTDLPHRPGVCLHRPHGNGGVGG